MEKLHLEIITPSKIGYTGNVISVTVPGTNGNFQILFNHAPIISSLEIGEIKIEESEGSKLHFSTSGGTIELSNNKIIILAESLERSDNIDVKRAEDAKSRAENRLKNKRSENIDELRAEFALKRAINRLKIANKFSLN
ncbi:MAG: F0F1 ATP synthase subunit epsilon [Ignavibacteriales bacterium]|nr:F0F1 ATP synthase subunit epsilon [Ignavibacteriales bacterium]